MCLLEFECAKRLKAHGQAIPADLLLNSLAPSDAIWGHKTWSTLIQVMARYRHQSIIWTNRDLHSNKTNFTESTKDIHSQNEFGKYTFKITPTPLRPGPVGPMS